MSPLGLKILGGDELKLCGVPRAQYFAPMSERDAEVFQVLIGQVGENSEIYVVLGKALSVLGHAELFEPVRNLLHRGSSTGFAAAQAWSSYFWSEATKRRRVYSVCPRKHTFESK